MRERRLVAIVDDEKEVCRAIGRLVISAGFESETLPAAILGRHPDLSFSHLVA